MHCIKLFSKIAQLEKYTDFAVNLVFFDPDKYHIPHTLKKHAKISTFCKQMMCLQFA